MHADSPVTCLDRIGVGKAQALEALNIKERVLGHRPLAPSFTRALVLSLQWRKRALLRAACLVIAAVVAEQVPVLCKRVCVHAFRTRTNVGDLAAMTNEFIIQNATLGGTTAARGRLLLSRWRDKARAWPRALGVAGLAAGKTRPCRLRLAHEPALICIDCARHVVCAIHAHHMSLATGTRQRAHHARVLAHRTRSEMR